MVADVPMWVVCGKQDELYERSVAPTVEALHKSHKAELRVSIFDTVKNPDRSDVEHQHFSWVPVTFDMIYNDGEAYDPQYPDGVIAWLMSNKLNDAAGHGATHGYAMGNRIIDAGLIDSYAFETGDPAIGRMDYYLYNPIKHGADPNRNYPLLVVFHGGGNGGMNDIRAGAFADGMVYASPEYQKLLGGAYILFPKANEYEQPRVFEDGSVSQPTGGWLILRENRPSSQSLYTEALHKLISKVSAENAVSSIVIAGTSMGGGMTWRYILDHTESVAAAILQAPAMNPSLDELDKLDKAGLPIWLIHGIQDEVCNINNLTGSLVNKLYAMPSARVSLLPWIRYGDGSVVRGAHPMEMGQHLALFAFGANMVYDNGTPYDTLNADSITDWLNRHLNVNAQT